MLLEENKFLSTKKHLARKLKSFLGFSCIVFGLFQNVYLKWNQCLLSIMCPWLTQIKLTPERKAGDHNKKLPEWRTREGVKNKKRSKCPWRPEGKRRYWVKQMMSHDGVPLGSGVNFHKWPHLPRMTRDVLHYVIKQVNRNGLALWKGFDKICATFMHFVVACTSNELNRWLRLRLCHTIWLPSARYWKIPCDLTGEMSNRLWP